MTLNKNLLYKNKIWNTRSISIQLYNSDSPSKLKKTEVWLEKQGLNFNSLNELNVLDEQKREPKKYVIEKIIDVARKKRKSVLFAALYKVNDSYVLFANDGRKGRRWFFFENVNPSLSEKSKALEKLALAENKNTVVIPHGELVLFSRQIYKNWKKNYLSLENSYKLNLALEVFSHGYHDYSAFINEKLRYTFTGKVTHLDRLEAESIHIIREVISDSQNPVMLYSVGKDSSVMLHLARKAFYPSTPPFPLLHVDTRWKFQSMYDFRDYMAKESGMKLITHINPEGVEKNINPIDHGSSIHTNIMKTEGLKQALEKYKFDVAFGGARRDEEKSRAKERICSFRTSTHRWDPKTQRPELWDLYNLRKNIGENIRVFPLSNWTELDVWQYIYREQIPIVPLYFAAERPFIERDGMMIMLDDNRLKLHKNEEIKIESIRFRTLGCYPLTGAIRSNANDLASIVLEIINTKNSERQGRAIDSDISASMELKKQEGYF